DGIRAFHVTGVQTCALPIYGGSGVGRPGREIGGPMTTWEQLVRAYVASGRRYWDELDVAQKEALAVAYFRECWRDLGDAAFPSKAAAHDLLGHIADHAYVGRVL